MNVCDRLLLVHISVRTHQVDIDVYVQRQLGLTLEMYAKVSLLLLLFKGRKLHNACFIHYFIRSYV